MLNMLPPWNALSQLAGEWAALAELTAAWILTYLLHSTLLLAIAWLAFKVLPQRSLPVKEALWKQAMLGGLATATLQVGLGLQPTWTHSAASVNPHPATVLEEPAGWHEQRARALPFPHSETKLLSLSETSPESAPIPKTIPPQDDARLLPDARTAAKLVPALWLLGALPLLLLLGLSHLRLHRRLRERREVARSSIAEVFARLRAAAGLHRPVRLTTSSRIAVPLARGLVRQEICLPTRALTDMTPEEHESVLAHELAHLKRRDPAWLLLGRLLEAVFFFQPLNRLARRRLQEIAEYRCDDWTVARTGKPLTLARCLTEVAGWSLDRATPSWSPGLAEENSSLGPRVQRLLASGQRTAAQKAPRWLTPLALGVLAVTVVAAPGVSAPEGETPDKDKEPAQVLAPPAPAPAQEPSAPAAPTSPSAKLATPVPTPLAIPLAEPRPVAVAPAAPAPAQEPAAPATETPAEEGETGEEEVVEEEISDEEVEETLEEELQALERALEKELQAVELELESIEMAVEQEMEVVEKELELELEAIEEEVEGEFEALEADFEALVELEARHATEAEELEQQAIREEVQALAEAMGELGEIVGRTLAEGLEPSLTRNLGERLAPLVAEITRLAQEQARIAVVAAQAAEAEHRAREGELSPEKMDQLREEVRRLREEARPNAEERAKLREQAERIARETRLSREEVRRLRSELRDSIEERRDRHRVRLEELRRQREQQSERSRKRNDESSDSNPQE